MIIFSNPGNKVGSVFADNASFRYPLFLLPGSIEGARVASASVSAAMLVCCFVCGRLGIPILDTYIIERK